MAEPAACGTPDAAKITGGVRTAFVPAHLRHASRGVRDRGVHYHAADGAFAMERAIQRLDALNNSQKGTGAQKTGVVIELGIGGSGATAANAQVS
jgi:hypothetical protein